MLRITVLSIASAMGATLFAAFLPLPVEAAVVFAKMQQNGSGACQGALPAFSGTLRARPLALQNEGNVTAFATCSPIYNDQASNDEGATAVNLRLVNNGEAAVDVTCTLVDGTSNPSVEVVYLPEAINLAAGATSSVSWTPLDYPAPQPDRILRPNVSCALPSGVGIAYISYFFPRQVGE